jgi:hypothetical protein
MLCRLLQAAGVVERNIRAPHRQISNHLPQPLIPCAAAICIAAVGGCLVGQYVLPSAGKDSI